MFVPVWVKVKVGLMGITQASDTFQVPVTSHWLQPDDAEPDCVAEDAAPLGPLGAEGPEPGDDGALELLEDAEPPPAGPEMQVPFQVDQSPEEPLRHWPVKLPGADMVNWKSPALSGGVREGNSDHLPVSRLPETV